MAALLAVMGLMGAAVPATAGAGPVNTDAKCGGQQYIDIPFTQTRLPIPTC